MTSSPSAGTAGVRTYRQPGGRVFAVVLLGVAAICAFNAAVDAGDPPAGIRIFNAVAALLLLLAAPVQWRAGVTVSPVGVLGRTQLGRRNVRLPWAEVHHFEMRGYWKGLCAVTTQGRVRSVMLMGFQTGAVDEVLRQLEDYRWEQQQAQGLV